MCRFEAVSRVGKQVKILTFRLVIGAAFIESRASHRVDARFSSRNSSGPPEEYYPSRYSFGFDSSGPYNQERHSLKSVGSGLKVRS